MGEIEKLNARIEELRHQMNRLIEMKEDNLDYEVIDVSKKLDNLLNEYEEEHRKREVTQRKAL